MRISVLVGALVVVLMGTLTTALAHDHDPVTAGAFCASHMEGEYGRTSDGVLMQCRTSSTDTRLRWREVGATFGDILNTVHRDDIEDLAAAGITKGCDPPGNYLFCPTDPVRRDHMAAFMVRALNLTDDSHPGFADVPVGSTFDRDIRRLAAAGITRGCNPPENTLYCPTNLVTRDQMAAFMVRALGLTATSPGGTFEDVPSNHTFATDINKLSTAGITKGCNPPSNTRYCPSDPVLRQQMASFMVRAGLTN